MNVLKELQQLLDDPSLIIDEEMQSLWSGYGQIIRCKTAPDDRSYVVKVVMPLGASDHPRGWSSSISHQRKIKSYQVEHQFYQRFSQLTDDHCKVPRLIASKTIDDCTLMVLEDLDEQGYFVRKEQADWHTLTLAIRWLAYFHANFIGNKEQGLWSTGTYWHLSTRQDEWAAMGDCEFKTHAKAIDDVLNQAQFQTLVHGDAKFENLCFHHQGKTVAAVDFQYIGCGSGVKDLAYLVGSCLTGEQLKQYDDVIVEQYLSYLQQALKHYQVKVDFDALAQETKALYPIAWADFYRFLLGWNPQSWKIGSFMKEKSAQGLAFIKNSQ